MVEAGARIKVHVQPRAARSEIVGMHGDAIKIRLAAPPVDNAANHELVKFLAAQLGLGHRQLRVAAGLTSRSKIVAIEDPEAQAIVAALVAAVTARPGSPV